jgi:hypothetical protein
VSDVDHLNEKTSTRGSNCTSVDALIYGKHEDGRKILFPVEWKYTEAYGNDDKASGAKGVTRKGRYTDLINDSDQLKDDRQKTYYFEPFYQLMRQTLWAKQVVAHKGTETIKADDYIHIHVIPSENRDLLQKKYPCSGGSDMETTWRDCLKDQSKYIIVTPQRLLEPLGQEKQYNELMGYLARRYWNPSEL